MSINAIRNRFRDDANRGARATTAQPRSGRVTSYDPAHMSVKVLIEPDGFETGWLPIRMPWAGSGWGLFAAPTIGAEVEVHFQEGGRGAGYVALSGWSASTPPLAVPSGEFWLVHQSGTFLKLTNDGKVSLHSGSEIDVGDLLNALQTLCTKALHDWAVNHVHGNGNGGANTTAPTTSPPANSLTTILKAN